MHLKSFVCTHWLLEMSKSGCHYAHLTAVCTAHAKNNRSCGSCVSFRMQSSEQERLNQDDLDASECLHAIW